MAKTQVSTCPKVMFFYDHFRSMRSTFALLALKNLQKMFPVIVKDTKKKIQTHFSTTKKFQNVEIYFFLHLKLPKHEYQLVQKWNICMSFFSLRALFLTC